MRETQIAATLLYYIAKQRMFLKRKRNFFFLLEVGHTTAPIFIQPHSNAYLAVK
jgi:hypothetical protein